MNAIPDFVAKAISAGWFDVIYVEETGHWVGRKQGVTPGRFRFRIPKT